MLWNNIYWRLRRFFRSFCIKIVVVIGIFLLLFELIIFIFPDFCFFFYFLIFFNESKAFSFKGRIFFSKLNILILEILDKLIFILKFIESFSHTFTPSTSIFISKSYLFHSFNERDFSRIKLYRIIYKNIWLKFTCLPQFINKLWIKLRSISSSCMEWWWSCWDFYLLNFRLS